MKVIGIALIFANLTAWIYVYFSEPYGNRLTSLVIASVVLASISASLLSLIPDRFLENTLARTLLSTLVFLVAFPFLCTALIRVVSLYEWSVVEPGTSIIYNGTSGMQRGDLYHTVFASFLPGIAFLVFQAVTLIRDSNWPNKHRHSPPDRSESK